MTVEKWIQLSKESREPIYHQLEKQIQAWIAGGQLPPGTLLPSIRSLSKKLEVSMITTRRAYQNLEHKGFVLTIQGKGTFVQDIDASLKQQVKVSTVYDILEKALVTALNYNYTTEQIEEIFHEILHSHTNSD
ncbi:GntR family transcriptional regulator [Virgibacillus xinjiangensis]|uniref:GntR family transcriptional regulator n=1 Tax=Virgibacillus xinjiangensis TaxID=393090 RepID=A0ABV7CXU2_9BACI